MLTYKIYVGNKEVNFNNFEGVNSHELMTIDKLTSMFNNEAEFKEFLIRNKFIDAKDIEMSLKIKYKLKGEKTLPLLYRKHLSYINPNDCLESNFELIYSEIKAHSYDPDFLKYVCYFYKGDYYEQMRCDLNNIRSNEMCPDSERRTILEETLAFLCISSRDGDCMFNYKAMRKLGFLMYDYDSVRFQKKKPALDPSTKTLEYTKDGKCKIGSFYQYSLFDEMPGKK